MPMQDCVTNHGPIVARQRKRRSASSAPAIIVNLYVGGKEVSQLHANARCTYSAVCDLACAGHMRESGADQRLNVVR